MAQRNRNRNARERDDEYEDAPLHIRPPDPAEESYAAFMGKWGKEGAKVRVYRVTPQGKQYCFLDEPENVDPETIRQFHARQLSFAHEPGSYLIEVEVNGEVRPPFPILIAPQVAPPGTPDHGSNGSNAILQAIQAQNERLERLLLQQHQTPMNELADTLIKLDTLRGGGPAKELPMDTLIKAVELGKTLGGGGAAETDWTTKLFDVLKDNPSVVPAVTGLLSRIIPGNGSAPPVQTQENNEMMEEQIMRQGITWLKRKALAGSDPGLYIDIVVDNQDDGLYAKLISRILENDFSTFAALDADISRPEYEPFFRAIYDGIRSVFIQPDKVVLDTARAGGNDGDTAKDGKPSKGSKKQS